MIDFDQTIWIFCGYVYSAIVIRLAFRFVSSEIIRVFIALFAIMYPGIILGDAINGYDWLSGALSASLFTLTSFKEDKCSTNNTQSNNHRISSR